MSVMNRLRISLAVLRYDFWLDLKGVPGKHRKVLRQELQANLADAAADLGAAAAVERVGSLKTLAGEAAQAHRRPDRPAWAVGAYWAGFVYAGLLFATFMLATVWTDAVVASGVRDQEVTGSWTFLPGVRFTSRVSGEGETLDELWFAIDNLNALLVWPLLAFLLGSRIWRLITGRRSEAHVRVSAG